MTAARRVRLTSRALLAAGVAIVSVLACSTNVDLIGLARGSFLNLTTKRQGNVLIGFVNNTTFRAIFTFGGYESLDENTTPVINQLRLESGSASTVVTQACRRVFSIGGADLIRLVQARGVTQSDNKALVNGVNFSSAPNADPLGTSPTEGTAAPLALFQGNDYLCAGLLLFSFEQDATVAGGFRIDYRFIPQK